MGTWWELISKDTYFKEKANRYSPEICKSKFLAASKESISTGFLGIDRVLRSNRPYLPWEDSEGGLPFGQLIVLGGASGVGKTGLALNIMENMAKLKQDVFVYSLAMSRRELIARSISRQSYLNEIKETSKALDTAVEYSQLLHDPEYTYNSELTHTVYREAVKTYAKTIGNKMSIFERKDVHCIESIEASVAAHVRFTGVTPIILIDYLQLLSGSNNPPTKDKEAQITANALRLKALAQKYNTTVIAISSINHSSYTKPVTRDCFKEFGELESISDVLLGLQPQEVSTNKAQREYLEANRELELVILKNRNGNQGKAYLKANIQINNFEDDCEENF